MTKEEEDAEAELMKAIKEVRDTVRKQAAKSEDLDARMDALEAALSESSQTKNEPAKEAPAPPPPTPKKYDEDKLHEYVGRLMTVEEEREKRKVDKSRVRTADEIERESANVLSRMLREVQEE